jgi:NAD(P)H-flavin reductase
MMAEGWADRPAAAIAVPMSLEEPYELIGIERCTATIAELWLRPLGSVLEYLPGECVLLRDDRHEVPPRSFSLANAPRSDGPISLLVTRVPEGETSLWVHDRLRVGQPVSVSGPYGTFVDDPTSTTPALFLAAGSGLAPIRALIEAAVSNDAHQSLTLILSARTEADVIDRKRFEEWQAEHRRFRFIRTLTPAVGARRPAGGCRRCCPRCTPTSQIMMCSWRAHPGSCWYAQPLLTRSARGASACARRCSSSNRSRGRRRRSRWGQGDESSAAGGAPPI